jgi:hypothetical protein
MKKTRKYTVVNVPQTSELQLGDFQSTHEVSSHCLQSRDTQVHWKKNLCLDFFMSILNVF